MEGTFAPASAIVVEDSPSGIGAARAVGVGHVVGLGARSPPAGPDVVVAGELTGLWWEPPGQRLDPAAVRR